MRAAFFGHDASYNGRFLAGVLTTGIYCLPSCGARKPKPENIRFFADEEEARAAGLRPCRRCRPDAFYRGEDPDLEAVSELAREIRAAPEAFSGVADLVERTGMGATKLTELFRRHLHIPPSSFLSRARVENALRRLVAGERLTETGFAVGYESVSAFHDAFRRATRMTPGDYRSLVLGRNGSPTNGGKRLHAVHAPRLEATFVLELPSRFRPDPTRLILGRDPAHLTERAEGPHLAKALPTSAGPALLTIELDGRRARCRVQTRDSLSPLAAAESHRAAVALLGLQHDPESFERRMLARPRLAPLVATRRGLRVPRLPSVFEGFVWAIVGQQVSLKFAAALRSDLIRIAGRVAPGGFRTHPEPGAVASLEPDELTHLRYSRRKAEYLIDGARLIASGELDLERLPDESATRAERTLRAVRGIGPWSGQFILMRGCGFRDCIPVGDAGLTEALRRFFDLGERPGPTRTHELMEPFAPHRSLATTHLWMSLGTAP